MKYEDTLPKWNEVLQIKGNDREQLLELQIDKREASVIVSTH